jgi:hypothetical protein
MANGRANLPRRERALLRGIVADEQDRVRFIQIVHARARRAGFRAERRDQAHVVRAPVMIDVVRADRRARNAPEQIVLFIRRAVRADEADRVRAVGLVHLGEAPGNLGQRVFPAGGHKLSVAAHQRKPETLGMLRVVEAEAALGAQKIPIYTGEVAIIGAQNFVVAHAERRLAAVRAVRANCGDVAHFPRPRLVAVRAARQRAHGANVDAHAALFALEMILAVRNDRRLRAALTDAERLHVHALVANAHAAEAQNAARRVVVHRVRPLLLGLVALLLVEAALVRAVGEDHVLQFALAALVAHRAIERMIGEQEFQHALARFVHLWRAGADHHARGRDQRARSLELRRLFHFHEAHAASRLKRQPGKVAERRHLNAHAPRSFNHQRPWRDGHVAVVNLQRDVFGIGHFVLVKVSQLAANKHLYVILRRAFRRRISL